MVGESRLLPVALLVVEFGGKTKDGIGLVFDLQVTRSLLALR